MPTPANASGGLQMKSRLVDALLNVEEKKSVWSSQLQLGVTKRFTLVFDAPGDAKGLKLHIPAGFGFGKSATIKVPTAGD